MTFARTEVRGPDQHRIDRAEDVGDHAVRDRAVTGSVGAIANGRHLLQRLRRLAAVVFVAPLLAVAVDVQAAPEPGDEDPVTSDGTVTAPATAAENSERGGSWSLADAPERVVIVSDSAIAGIRWTGALGDLTNALWIDRLESCRRLVRSSCRGREGYRPLTAYFELQRYVGQHGLAHPDDVLVIAVGYNDWHGTFASDFVLVMEQARRSGFQHVAWLTYREDNTYTLPGDSAERTSNYRFMNQILRQEHASGRWPELTLFDYDAATAGQTSWFAASDGIHVTPTGARAVAQWLSSQILYSEHPEFAPDNWIPPTER
ncbi:MAG: SGNH/GDSL hydrolase family protein [Actinomycetota bacterium]